MSSPTESLTLTLPLNESARKALAKSVKSPEAVVRAAFEETYGRPVESVLGEVISNALWEASWLAPHKEKPKPRAKAKP